MLYTQRLSRALSGLAKGLWLSVALLSAAGVAGASADKPLRIGTTAAFASSLEAAVSEAAKQGLEVELIEFSDWNTPNVTLAHGDIDANFFQSPIFLENANKAGGFKLEPYAIGITTYQGLYSKKHKRLNDIPNGARVAIAGDHINAGRALRMLEDAGLIKLKPGVGYKGSREDIIDNSRNLKLVEIEAVQLVRAFDDFDLVQGMPHYIRLSGAIDPASALHFDINKINSVYFVSRPESKNDTRLKKFVDIYYTAPSVRAALDQSLGQFYKPGWEL